MAALRSRLDEAEELLEALRSGKVDAILGLGSSGDRILKLEGSEDPYRLVVETMGEGAITLSAADNTILYCNRRFAEMMQNDPAELVGSRFSDLVATSSRSAWDAILPNGTDEIKREHLQLQRPCGDVVPVQVAVRSLASSGVKGLVAIVTDLTELEKAQGAKDRFFANMSHELRTPLTGMLGYVGILLMKMGGPLTAEQERQLSIVKASGQHLLALINNLLDFSKIESEKVEINVEPISCLEVVRAVAVMLEPLASAKGLTLEVEVQDDRDIIVLSDRRTVSQILINLVGNSIKFTKTGGIRIVVHQTQSHGRSITNFSVVDTGCGITSEVKEKLFKAFFLRVRGTPTKRIRRTGLE